MTPLRMAVVSYDHLHTPRYAQAIVDDPGWQLAAVVEEGGVNPTLARHAADHYGVPFYGALDALIATGSVDAMYIGTMPTAHLGVVQAAANAGIHVLCDKPIAVDLETADAVIAAADAGSIRLMVPFNPRFQLPVQRVKERLDAGEAGELVAVNAIKWGRLPTTATGPQDPNWFVDPAVSGGGGFLDVGIHAVDALCWLADAPPATVYAEVGTHVHPDLEVEDLGVATVEFANGVVGMVSAGWANPPSSPAWLEVRFEILTTTDAFFIDRPYHDYAKVTRTAYERPAWWRVDVAGVVAEFAAAIREERDPLITGLDARRALAVTLAAYESARTGRTVDLT